MQQLTKMQQAIASNDESLVQQACEEILQVQYHSSALLTLANIGRKYYRFEQVARMLEEGTKQDTNNPLLWSLMTKVLADKCSYAKAIEAAKTLVSLQPKHSENWLLYISTLNLAGQNQAAIEACHLAVTIAEPHSSSALKLTLQLGHLYKASGMRKQAQSYYQNCLQHPELLGDGYWALANLKTYQFSQAELETMQRCLQQSDLNAQQRSSLCFALGKACEDTMNFPLAFEYYQQANDSKPNVKFSPEQLADKATSCVKQYDQQSLTIQAEIDSKAAIPIFIVGLPRSGSTLLEQMLAGHSKIEATAELMVLPNALRRLQIRTKLQNISEKELLIRLSPDDLAAFGRSYLHETAIYRQGKPYFIDKLPANFQHIGLIHKILPQAIIVDIRRHPIACGYSNFKQNYAAGQDFSYKLEHFAAYYRYYLKLMAHWQTLLPGKIWLIDFATLLDQPKQQMTKLLNYCGLEFESQTLNFHQQKTIISTSSSEQVRQPIDPQVNQNWQRYSVQLTRLRTDLDDIMQTWSDKH